MFRSQNLRSVTETFRGSVHVDGVMHFAGKPLGKFLGFSICASVKSDLRDPQDNPVGLSVSHEPRMRKKQAAAKGKDMH